MSKKRTITDYLDLASRKNINLIGEVPRSVTDKTVWKCKHDHMWETSYHTLARGSGCPHCAGKAKRTKYDYLELAKSRGFTLIGEVPRQVIHGTLWRCHCGHEWEARYTSIQMGAGCPACAGNAQKTKCDYDELAETIGYQHIGNAPSSVKKHTTWLCSSGHKWTTSFDSIKNGNRCAHCAGNARLTNADYHEMAKCNGFQFLDSLPNNVGTPVLWQCSKDHKWKAAYYNIQSDRGCPRCARSITNSSGEIAVARALRSLGVGYEKEKRFDECKDKRPLPFDFYFTYNKKEYLCEYNGAQHYHAIPAFGGEKAFKERCRRDNIKTEWAITNGFTLIIIDYTVSLDDIENILKLILYDNDAAGVEGANKVRQSMRRAKIATLPEGIKDVGELWTTGNAAQWLKEKVG